MSDSATSMRFEPTWPSLQRYRVPGWYQDAKFGIFIHWGAYAVPAFGNEWYPRNMYQQGSPEFEHHIATYGPQTGFGYKDFIPRFRAERFDPRAWATLFAEAGARYVVAVAEHHDGFAMYDCSLSSWTAVRMGPCRDLVGELAQAVRQQGLVFGVSSHRAEHWWFFNSGRQFPSDVHDQRYAELYGPAQPQESQPDQAFLDDWLARSCELVERYAPQVFYFDWWIEQPVFEPYLQRFAAFYYNRAAEWGQGVAINYKESAFPEGTAVYDVERGRLMGIAPRFWQACTSVSKNSWGYVERHDYKSAGSLIGDLVDIVSRNGTLLLNIGPRADGTIPEPEQQILREIGRWLAVNGAAIYGTRPWVVEGEGPTQLQAGKFTDTERQAFTSQDIRFTTRGNTLYAICLGWPAGELRIRSLGAGSPLPAERIAGIQMLGAAEPLSWSQQADHLSILLPAQPPCEHAHTFQITLKQ